MTHSLEFRCNS